MVMGLGEFKPIEVGFDKLFFNSKVGLNNINNVFDGIFTWSVFKKIIYQIIF